MPSQALGTQVHALTSQVLLWLAC